MQPLQAPTASPVRLEARDLTFGYAHNPPVIENWSAQFDAGSMTALTGASGRGKSTLLYLLGLMLSPQTGTVLVNGNDTTTMTDPARSRMRARTFGFVFQDAALDQSRTVLDNVTETALYRGDSRRTAHTHALELLERFGVNVPPTRTPGQVSGGQAQRIALCRALLNQPGIVLADEPTGNLDPDTAALVIDALRTHSQQGAAVIVVTHSADVAAACDRELTL